jgi:ankyrin repeat protein
MEAEAIKQGWGRVYTRSPEFKENFDQMCVAIAALPPPLLERVIDYPYPQLHRACVDGDLELVSALLEAGICPMSYVCSGDDDDGTPLVWLAQEKMDFTTKVAVADLLLARGADPDEGDPLEAALDEGDEAFANYLISRGASV